jgi:hypothetical protein
MKQMRDIGRSCLGVPPPDPFSPQGCAREQAGSGFPLQVLAAFVPQATVGFPLQSVTRNTSALYKAIRPLLILLIVVLPKLSTAQDSTALDREVAQVIDQISYIHSSPRSVYFFDLDSIPLEVMKKLLANSHMEGKIGPKAVHEFMADQGEPYEGTDVILNTNAQPSRKFLFGQSLGRQMFFIYLHGGIGNHLHLVYVDQRDTMLISSFVTLTNWITLHTLNFQESMEKVKTTPLTSPLVRPDEMKALNSKVYAENDLF